MATDYKDQITRFLFEELGVRGEIVSLDKSFQDALALHNYPAIVADQLGQMLTSSVLLSATLKFDGSLIIQMQGDGPISMLVAQSTNNQSIRGLAHWNEGVEKSEPSSLFGDARLTLTIKPSKGKAYQGIVNFEGESLSESLEAYFKQSEQLKTRLWFAVNEQRAVGILLQELPAHLGEAADWQRVEMLADTVTSKELLELHPEDVIHRLFHEELIRLFEPEDIDFKCDCSRDKVETSLLTLGYEDLKQLLEQKGLVEVDCDFCNKHYQFDSIDIEQLFSATRPAPSKRQH